MSVSGKLNFGVSLMRRLKLRTKLALLSALVLIPTLLISSAVIQRMGAELKTMNQKLIGTTEVVRVSELITLVQKHRGTHQLVLAGSPGAAARLASIDGLIHQQSLDLADVLKKSALERDPKWIEILEKTNFISKQTPADADESFMAHTDLVSSLEQLAFLVGQKTHLAHDFNPVRSILANLLIVEFNQWAEVIGQARGLVSGQLARAASSPAKPPETADLIRQISHLKSDINFAEALLAKHNENFEASDTARKAIDRFRSLTRLASTESGKVGANEFFNAGTKTIEAIASFQHAVEARLEGLVLEQVNSLKQWQWFIYGAISLTIALLGYLIHSFYRSFFADFQSLTAAMAGAAKGDLRTKINLKSKDEMGDMSRLLQRMINQLSMMVAEIRSNAALVAYSGQRLTLGNRELAERTEQQAENVERTAASVHELATTVSQNAETASDSDRQAVDVRSLAEVGGSAMESAIKSVEVIQQSAVRMNEIISTIDSIAFQTNVLALNAAVEAARAGEQGRGFAVVADEVRTLAQRSSAASKEVRDLIEASVHQVEGSMEQIRSLGGNMEQIVAGVRSVAGNMSLISAASSEQSDGLVEVSSSLSSIDGITQRNSQMVERATEQASNLSERASTLADAVSSFQLQQGTADEALQFVEKALELRKRVSKEAYTHELTNPQNHFYDRDMYVFAFNPAGEYVAFGGSPDRVGTSVHDLKGVDGEGLFRSIVDQAEVEPGWVEYDIQNPQTGLTQAKMSYVVKVDSLYVGCGIYKSAVIEAEA